MRTSTNKQDRERKRKGMESTSSIMPSEKFPQERSRQSNALTLCWVGFGRVKRSGALAQEYKTLKGVRKEKQLHRQSIGQWCVNKFELEILFTSFCCTVAQTLIEIKMSHTISIMLWAWFFNKGALCSNSFLQNQSDQDSGEARKFLFLLAHH